MLLGKQCFGGARADLLGLIGSRLRLAFAGILVTLAATACGSAALGAPPIAPDGPLVQQLTGEVSDAGALKHLQALQKIADKHGGNRAAGTTGYDASVDYVVGVLRDIGFKASTPTFVPSGRDGDRGPQRNVIAQTRTGDPITS